MIQFIFAPTIRPSILPIDVRESMHKMGWTEVHQSDLNSGRECPAKLPLTQDREHGPVRRMSAYALLGSALHKAVEQPMETETLGDNVDYWIDLMEQVMFLHPNTHYYNGRILVDSNQVVRWARSFTMFEGDGLGVRPRELIMSIHEELDSASLVIEAAEKSLKITDGVTNSIVFDGTADLILRQAGGAGPRVLLDTKFGGMLGVYVEGASSSIKKQSYSIAEVQCHTQLRHYHWMLDHMGINVDFYGLLFPANMVPYKTNGKDYKKGDRRGPLIQMAPVYSADFVHQYERDMAATITGWVRGGFYRALPNNYGKAACPSCPVFSSCVGSSRLNSNHSPQVQDYLDQYSNME